MDYQRAINKYAETHAPETVRTINIAVRSCVDYAVADGIITKNFTTGVNIAGNASNKRKIEYLSLKEIRELLHAAEKNLKPSFPSQYMIVTAIYTGARIGELSALHWYDLDFDKSTINICKSYSDVTHEVAAPKTFSSNRTITVQPKLLDMLKDLKVNNTDFVFGTRATKLPPSGSAVNKALKHLMQQANIDSPGYHFHSIRHSHVAYLLAKGIDIYAISKRLGHANISITLNVYAYLLDEFKNKEDQKIQNALKKL